MDDKHLNDELLRALAYYGAAGGSGGGGGGTGTNNYGDLLAKPILTSLKYPSGVTINGTKSIQDYGIAEQLQHFYDINKTQSASAAEKLILSLQDTANNSKLTLDTTDGIKAEKGTDSIRIAPNGTPYFTGTALYNLMHTLEDLISSSVNVPVSGWSASTQTINGVAYYTNELSFTKVYYEHPEVTIDSMTQLDVLPSAAQREAFGQVTSSGYFFANTTTNKITVYSQVKPTTTFKIRVKGAK